MGTKGPNGAAVASELAGLTKDWDAGETKSKKKESFGDGEAKDFLNHGRRKESILRIFSG